MGAGENRSADPKGNGHVNLCSQENKHDEKDMSKESSWTALPDLILTLIPTGILLTSGTTDGKSLSFARVDEIRQSIFDMSFVVICGGHVV